LTGLSFRNRIYGAKLDANGSWFENVSGAFQKFSAIFPKFLVKGLRPIKTFTTFSFRIAALKSGASHTSLVMVRECWSSG
jgi:hypothetical protein